MCFRKNKSELSDWQITCQCKLRIPRRSWKFFLWLRFTMQVYIFFAAMGGSDKDFLCDKDFKNRIGCLILGSL